MGKYDVDSRSDFGSDDNYYIAWALVANANEAAEANRLKRIEMQVTGGFISVNDKTVEELEDRAC